MANRFLMAILFRTENNMSLDLNRASLIGTMATDPNIRMAGDKQVCNFRLVTNWRGKDKQTSEFHTVICWDKLAENVGTFMNKGARLFVEGRLQTREWTSADGKVNKTTEIVADQVMFLDKREYKSDYKHEIGMKLSEPATLEQINGMVAPAKEDGIKLSDIPF